MKVILVWDWHLSRNKTLHHVVAHTTVCPKLILEGEKNLKKPLRTVLSHLNVIMLAKCSYWVLMGGKADVDGLPVRGKTHRCLDRPDWSCEEKKKEKPLFHREFLLCFSKWDKVIWAKTENEFISIIWGIVKRNIPQTDKRDKRKNMFSSCFQIGLKAPWKYGLPFAKEREKCLIDIFILV